MHKYLLQSSLLWYHGFPRNLQESLEANEDTALDQSINRPHPTVLHTIQILQPKKSPWMRVVPNSRSVLPLPNLPQMSESFPTGKLTLKSIKTNFFLGVDAADGVLLPRRDRSCGHVTVADWKAMIRVWSERGGTNATSVPCKYFSIRRRETRL
jgi:hypothetical protein